MLSPKQAFVVLIAVAVVFEIVADVLLKRWSIENRWPVLAGGLLLYFIGTVFWAYSLRYEQLSRAIVIFTVVNLVVISLVGVLLFDEKLSLWNKAGIGLGVVSVLLLEL